MNGSPVLIKEFGYFYMKFIKMKRTYLIASFIFFAHFSYGQCPKLVLLEDFTQASCQPSANQDLYVLDSILLPSPTKVHHIAYHVYFPGVDPMYSYNTSQIMSRINYYSVTQISEIKLLGNQKTGLPTTFNQDDINNYWSEGSPEKLEVSEVDNGSTRTVTIRVKTVGTKPAGSFNILACVIERNKTYAAPPGSNGEKYFPDVFRKMITAGDDGDSFALPAAGNDTTISYTYNEDSVNWALGDIGIVAFIQNNSTKEVIQSGSTFNLIPNSTMLYSGPTAVNGSFSNTTSFNFTAGNSGDSSEQFVYKITSLMPNDWTSNFIVNGSTYSDSAIITLGGNSSLPVSLNVIPGSIAKVGKFTFSITSLTNPGAAVLSKTFFVISGITDLIVNGSGTASGNFGRASKWQQDYINGLAFAGNTSFDVISADFLIKGTQGWAMNSVKNIFLNIGATAPSLTDSLVSRLTDFLNLPGKGLFVSGQDIGYEIWDAASTASPAVKTFYTDYLHAIYANDGSKQDSILTGNTADPVFGGVTAAAVNTAYYGSIANFYPDELNASGIGKVCFYYNNDVNKKAGVYSNNGTSKVVYLGIGIEQLADSTAKNTILKLSHDWFYGLITSEEFNKEMLGLSLGQNFPNPSGTLTFIPVSNLENNAKLIFTDILGRNVLIEEIMKGTSEVRINTSTLVPGIYHYTVVDGNNIVTKTMQVVK